MKWQMSYFPGPTYQRKPAALGTVAGDVLTTPDGEVLTAATLSDVLGPFDGPGLLICDSLGGLPFRAELTPYLVAGKDVTARIPRGSRGDVRIVPAAAWGLSSVLEARAYLPPLFQLLGATGPTPAVLGLRVQEKQYDGHRERWDRRPPMRAALAVKQHGTGGRIQRWKKHERTVQIDKRNAYLSACRRLPSGGVRRVRGTDGRRYPTWFMESRVRVPVSFAAAFSPVPVRVGGSPRWAPGVGEFTTWLWKEQAETAVAAGLGVEPLHGYAWPQWSTALSGYVDAIEEARKTAQNRGLERVDALLKRVAQAGIGVHGCTHVSRLYAPADAPANWEPMAVESPFSGLVVARELKEHAPMTHWYYWVMVQCQLAVYALAKPFARDGSLAEIRTDCIVIREDALPASIPEGYRIAR